LYIAQDRRGRKGERRDDDGDASPANPAQLLQEKVMMVCFNVGVAKALDARMETAAVPDRFRRSALSAISHEVWQRGDYELTH
jgi:hypothetical protein